MSDKLTIFKNKGEVFNCQFKIDGASTKDTVVRLCLEFENNKNFFFYGKMDDNGDCQIEIPKLKELDDCDGKLVVEAIADSIYFKVYEATVELKNSVQVTMTQSNQKQHTPQIKLEGIAREKKAKIVETTSETPKVEPQKPKSIRDKYSSFDAFCEKLRQK